MNNRYLHSSLLMISISDISNILKELIEENMLKNNISLDYLDDIFDYVITQAVKEIGETVNYNRISIFSAYGFDVSAMVYESISDTILMHLRPRILPYINYFHLNGKLKILVTCNEILLSKTKFHY